MVYDDEAKQQRKIDTWGRISDETFRLVLKDADLSAATHQDKEFKMVLNKEYHVGVRHFGNRPGIEIAVYRKDEKLDSETFLRVLRWLPYPLRDYATILKRGRNGRFFFLKGTVYPLY